MTSLGVIFPPSEPPERLLLVARAADDAGLDHLWLWEDCFKEGAIAMAAAALASTQRLGIGIGLMPVPPRNVALTAMEVATLERLFPGRVLPGVGHGVLDWMGQVGARAASPMTLLREYTSALRRLLHGETVTTSGQYVQLTDVTLDWPPTPAPPLLVGGERERTLTLAGELGDGAILAGGTGLDGVPEAIAHQRRGRELAGRDGAGDLVVFVEVDGRQPEQVAERVRAYTEAGATHVALHDTGDEPDLVRLVEQVAGLAR